MNQGDCASISGLLDAMLVHLDRLDPEARADMRPGLSATTIAELGAAHDLRIPEEVSELYQWRNGMRHNTAHFIYPRWEFPSLEQGLKASTELHTSMVELGREPLGQSWLVVFENMFGDELACDCGADSRLAPVHHCLTGGDDYDYERGSPAYVGSLAELLRRFLGMYESGAIVLAADGLLARRGEVPEQWSWPTEVL